MLWKCDFILVKRLSWIRMLIFGSPLARDHLGVEFHYLDQDGYGSRKLLFPEGAIYSCFFRLLGFLLKTDLV